MKKRRRAIIAELSAGHSGILPEQYQQVEYVKIVNDVDNGYTNGIDTGFTWGEFSSVKICAELYSGTGDNIILAGTTGATSSRTAPYITKKDSGVFDSFGFQSFSYLEGIDAENHKPLIITNFSSDSAATAMFGSWKTEDFSRTNKFYYIELLNHGVIAKYIPCYRKADNVIGFYDVINNVFKTNISNGRFEKGANV